MRVLMLEIELHVKKDDGLRLDILANDIQERHWCINQWCDVTYCTNRTLIISFNPMDKTISIGPPNTLDTDVLGPAATSLDLHLICSCIDFMNKQLKYMSEMDVNAECYANSLLYTAIKHERDRNIALTGIKDLNLLMRYMVKTGRPMDPELELD